MEEIFNISPIDGRYKEATEEVRSYFSEFYLIKNRVFVEIEWMKRLFLIKKLNMKYDEKDFEILDRIVNEFDLKQSEKVKKIEMTTKHDVKAVEYYLREKFIEYGLTGYCQFIHFACTSEDINNLAYGIMIKNLLDVYAENVHKLLEVLKEKAIKYCDVSMLSHTHGQGATPTTVGKEFSIYVYRVNKILNKIENEKISGKFNGTVGNFNAHFIAYPDVDWIKVSKEFVESFGLECNLFTTQIESHDNISIIFSEIKLLNNILLDFANDMWMYISRNYFLQENIKGEVGSSVMPHKINPINFENAMANLKMSNGVISALVDNLQISRMQRDLSDSSMFRNVGIIFAYSLISIKQLLVGVGKLKLNMDFLRNELNNTPEVLAEAIQTILRKNGYNDAYEILKDFTRGKNISNIEMKKFIEKLDIEKKDKERLLELNPSNYIGMADVLAKKVSEIL